MRTYIPIQKMRNSYKRNAPFIIIGIILVYYAYNYRNSAVKKVREDRENTRFILIRSQLEGSEDGEVLTDDESVTEQNINRACSTPHLKDPVQSAGHRDGPGKSTCKRSAPTSESCLIINQLFGDMNTENCDIEVVGKICELMESGGTHHISCETTLCSFPIAMGTIPYETGEVNWVKYYNESSLQAAAEGFLQPSIIRKHVGMIFFNCYLVAYTDDVLDDDLFTFEAMYTYKHYSQLLMIPANIYMQKRVAESSQTGSNININLLHIDSASRSHFYRSLPRSVHILNSMNKHDSQANKKDHSNMVLDFELFQALRSRTFESLQALFAGYVNPYITPFGTYAMPPIRFAPENLLLPAKKLGYNTLWLEDLCWKWEWGLAKDLRVFNKTTPASQIWSELTETLKNVGIDELGATLASCEILKANSVNDPFHGPDTGAVCYGGKYHHDYQLQYLTDYQAYMDEKKRPYFSVFETSVSHEKTGLRIQGLDKALSEYLEYVSRLENTLTIVFADHGNTYGDFVAKSLEGKIETFHPALFMILPTKVREHLGLKNVENLIANQNKLVSFLDLHFMLRNVLQVSSEPPLMVPGKPIDVRNLYQVSDKGLLSAISSNRSCHMMPRIMPHTCICEGFENSVNNNSYYAMFAHFAVVKMNEVLHKQYRAGNQGGASYGRCRPLVVSHFSDVKVRYEQNDTRVIMMDIHVDLLTNRKPEVFFVVIYEHLKVNLQLVRFERRTEYSPFSVCKDSGVDTELCICQANSTQELIHSVAPALAVVYTDYPQSSLKCFYTLALTNKQFIFLHAVNECPGKQITINVQFVSRNVLLIKGKKSLIISLKPFDVNFFIGGIIDKDGKEILWKYSLSFEISSQ